MTTPLHAVPTVPPIHSGRREAVFRVVVLAVLAAVLIAWLVYGLFRQPRLPDQYTNSYSHSPGGHSALVELLERHGYRIQRDANGRFDEDRNLYYWPRNGNTLALLEPGEQFITENPDGLARLCADPDRVPNLVLILPKRVYHRVSNNRTRETSSEDDKPDAIVLQETLLPLSDARAVLDATPWGAALGLRRTEKPVPIEHGVTTASVLLPDDAKTVQCFVPDAMTDMDFVTLLETEDGEAVAVLIPNDNDAGGAVLVSDPDIFTNRYLGYGQAAELALAVFAETTKDIIIDESMHGYATDASLEYIAATPPGLWVTLSVFLLLGLFAWREATVLMPASGGARNRRSRAYAIEGLARLMARARDYPAATLHLLRRAGIALAGQSAKVGNAQGINIDIRPRADHDARLREFEQRIDDAGPQTMMEAAELVSALKSGREAKSEKP